MALKAQPNEWPDELAIPPALLRSVAAWAYRLSPLVAYDRPPAPLQRIVGKTGDARFTGINLDVAGCERLFGGDAPLLQRAEEGLSALLAHGMDDHRRQDEPVIRFRCTLAPSLGAAWAFSRYGSFRQPSPYRSGKAFLLDKSALRQALAPLPLTALRLTPQVVTALAEVELSNIGQLLSIPRPALLSRFGQEPLLQLDRALGVAEEPLVPIPFVPALQESFQFTGPVQDQESLRAALRTTLVRLCARLSHSALRARTITLELHARELPPQRKELTVAQATTRHEHLFTLFSPHLEQMNMGNGVDRLKIGVSCTERSRPQVTSAPALTDETGDTIEHREKLAQLVDVLSEHLGPQRVRALTTHESHIPERSFSFTPLKESGDDFYRSLRLPAVPDRERPSLLFPQPRMIRALSTAPAGAPFQIEWRGNRYRVIQGVGPERIAPEWWGTDAELCRTRDYFKILLAPSAVSLQPAVSPSAPAIPSSASSSSRASSASHREAAPSNPLTRAASENAAPHSGSRGAAFSATPFPKGDIASSLAGCWLWVFRQLEDDRWFIHGIWA